MSEEANLRTPGEADAEAGSDDALTRAALDYHRYPAPGKISVLPTKDMTTQRDLALAYSPGVAAACMAIKHAPIEAFNLTSRGNLVAVISNGTAVLGLGNIGALAGKPVMEGKGCLFKKFAGIDVFDIEIDETDPDKLVEIIASLEPTFGGINLEDIKAPECFIIETRLRERMNIPVFHDDQHGTAIIAAAAVLNGLKVIGKRIETVKLVCSGAGAAAIACLNILVGLGVRKDNILVTDSQGVLTRERLGSLDEQKAAYARETSAHTLADAVEGADIFLGVSMGGVLKPEMVESMASRPLILALANPEPEIRPELAKEVRPDAIIATGRSDYPNQVNNVLCFPFIFRGALDVGATTINEEMKLAAVRAIAELAQAEQSDVVSAAYGTQDLRFGPDFLIPRPFDPRLILTVAPAVAQAAIDSGVATRPFADIETYRRSLQGFVYTSGHGDAAGLRRGGRGRVEAHRLRRGRGRSRAARRAGGGGRAPCYPDPGRATRRDRPEDQDPGPAASTRPRRAGRELRRRGIPGCRDGRLLPAPEAPGLVARLRGRRDAPQRHPHRRHAGALRPGGRNAVRHIRRLCHAPALRGGRDRAARRTPTVSRP